MDVGLALEIEGRIVEMFTREARLVNGGEARIMAVNAMLFHQLHHTISRHHLHWDLGTSGRVLGHIRQDSLGHATKKVALVGYVCQCLSPFLVNLPHTSHAPRCSPRWRQLAEGAVDETCHYLL